MESRILSKFNSRWLCSFERSTKHPVFRHFRSSQLSHLILKLMRLEMSCRMLQRNLPTQSYFSLRLDVSLKLTIILSKQRNSSWANYPIGYKHVKIKGIHYKDSVVIRVSEWFQQLADAPLAPACQAGEQPGAVTGERREADRLFGTCQNQYIQYT